MKYNPGIHHRRSIRLKGYDYSKEGLYFITICTHNRLCLFGEIENGEMILNDAGWTMEKYWLEIPKHYPNVVLHEHVVMPNHVHGIIEIESNVGVQNLEPLLEPLQPVHDHEPLQQHPQNKFQQIIPRSIGSIVRGCKIGMTKWFRKNTDIYRVWQRNYYEHVIRDEKSYDHISEYIQTNPLQWQDDKYYEYQ